MEDGRSSTADSSTCRARSRRRGTSLRRQWARQCLQGAIPPGLPRQAQTPAPGLGALESPGPVAQLERAIDRAVLWIRLLRAIQRRAEHRPSAFRVPRGKDAMNSAVSTRRCGSAPALRGLRARGTRAPRRRSGAAAATRGRGRRPRAIRLPSGSSSSASAHRCSPASPLSRGPSQDRVVVAEAPLEQRQAAPQRELRRVPPVHLEVELALPAVERQPRLLRRIAPGNTGRRSGTARARCAAPVHAIAGRRCRRDSIAPPAFQNRRQWVPAAGLASSNNGTGSVAGAGANATVSDSVLPPGSGASRYVWGPLSVSFPPGCQRAAAWYVSPSSVRANRASPSRG